MQQERKIYLPYMLSYLARAQFTGVLTLLEGERERAIYLNQGKAVHVRSPLVEETLGRLLLDEGRISQAQYQELLDLMVHTGRQAGELLISIGALGPHEVFAALEHQTRVKLNNSFCMVDFGFELQRQAVPPALLIAQIKAQDAILSGIQQAYTLGRLLNEFPVDEETRLQRRDERCPVGPREQRLLRQIGNGVCLADLLSKDNDLTYLVGALYCLHAMFCVEVAGVAWPRPDDLELGEMDIPRCGDDPTVAALTRSGGPTLLADWDSEPPPSEPEPPSAAPVPEPAQENPTPPAMEPRAPAEQAFSPPATQAVIHAGLVTPKLARKVLSMSNEDHFTLLGLSRDAGETQIKQAYHRAINAYNLDAIEKHYATDKEWELAERLLDHLTIAYRELSEESSRKAYVAHLRQRKKKGPRETPAHILADVEAQKGRAAFGAKNFSKARAHLEAAVRLDPYEPDHFYNLGRLDYQEALDRTPATQALPLEATYALQRAVELNPRHDKAHIYLGYFHKRNGALQAALQAFKSARDANPANRIATAEIRQVEAKIRESS